MRIYYNLFLGATIICVALILSTYSCDNPNSEQDSDEVLSLFEGRRIHMQAKDSISLEELQLPNVSRINRYKDWFILRLSRGRDFFAMYNPETKEFFTGVPKGRGPGESISVSFHEIIENKLYFYGYNERKIFTFDLDDAITKKKITVDSEPYLTFTSMSMPVRIFIIDSGLIGLGALNEKNTWYAIYDNEKGKIISQVDQPDFEFLRPLSPIQKNQVYTDFLMGISSDKKRVAVGGLGAGAISFAEINGSTLTELKRYELFPPKLKESTFDTDFGITYDLSSDVRIFSSIRHSGNNFYFLYSGLPLTFSDYPSWEGSYILSFDANGNPKRIYTLEKHITDFIFDEDNSTIWGVSGEPKTQIIKYELP